MRTFSFEIHKKYNQLIFLLEIKLFVRVLDVRPVRDDEVADARIKNECCDSDCFKEKSRIETKFTKSTKSSAPLRMGFARINAANAVIAKCRHFGRPLARLHLVS